MNSLEALGLSVPWAMALGAVLTLVAALLVLRLQASLRRHRLLARFENAAQGEVRARGYLEELGFEVLGAQVPAEYVVTIDDRAVPVRLRADYIVVRDGQRFVAEVKTGAVATQVETAATRRQLLEYRMAFEVDGVLLVDADKKRVSTVVFPTPASDTASGTRVRTMFPIALVCTAVVAAAVATWLAR